MVIEVCIFAQFAVCKNGWDPPFSPLNTLERSKICTGGPRLVRFLGPGKNRTM